MTPPTLTAPHRQRVDFVLELGRELHRHGVPAHRLELALGEVASQLDLESSFYATPTALFATLGSSESEETHLQRLEGSSVSLGKMADLDRLAQSVAHGELEVPEARRELARIASAPARHRPWVVALGYAIASASASRLFGGGSGEILTALGGGTLVGVLSLVARQKASIARLFEPLGAFLVAIAAGFLAALLSPSIPVEISVATLAGLIVLVPGLTVTIAVSELANGSLVSGTSRLFGAVLGFFMLGFGVALGQRLTTAILGPAPPGVPSDLPGWTAIFAAALTALAFTVLLDADRRDLGWILLAGLVTWGTAAAASETLGIELATLIGALVLGVVSNLYARRLRRPAMVTRVTAVLLLVPGAIGFRGVASFMADDALSGAEAVFTVALIAVAIVLGQLIGNAIVPPRRHL